MFAHDNWGQIDSIRHGPGLPVATGTRGRVRSQELICLVFLFHRLSPADFWFPFASRAISRLLSLVNFFEDIGDHRRSRGAAVDLAPNIAFVERSERILGLVGR